MSLNVTLFENKTADTIMSKLLLIDEDEEFRQTLSNVIGYLNCDLLQATSFDQGLQLLRNYVDIQLVLLNLQIPNNNTPTILKELLTTPDQPRVIITSYYNDPDTVAWVIENGVWEYIQKPTDTTTLHLILKRAISYQKQSQMPISIEQLQEQGLIGNSPCFLNCLEHLSKTIYSKSNVLLSGATGTGKELFARAIHNCGPRASNPFVTVDCASLPENLAESLLLGHTKGSFTGAHSDKTGLIKLADGGSLFLDEIGELPLYLQKVFLRILQERAVRPLGSTKVELSDFRLITATNKDIKTMVEQGHFRQDLYHRICTYHILLPPLVNRKEDISPLFEYFLHRACSEYNIAQKIPSQDFIECLEKYHWPGNVRELINVVYTSIDSAMDSQKLYPQHLPMNIRVEVIKSDMSYGREQSLEKCRFDHGTFDMINNDGSLPTLKHVRTQAMDQAELQYLNKVIHYSQGNIKEACRMAGISRPRFYELLKKHNINHHQVLSQLSN